MFFPDHFPAVLIFICAGAALFLLVLLILEGVIFVSARVGSAREVREAANLREALGDDPMGVFPGGREGAQVTSDAWQRAEKMVEAYYSGPWEAEKVPPLPLRGDDPDLVRAAQRGEHETVKQLLALGARLNVEGCGTTNDSALMAAIRSGSRETVECLLAADADLLRGVFQATPFEMAVSSGSRDILKLLLDRGAHVPEFHGLFDPVEEGVLMLFEIDEDALARNLARVAAGVELCRPDTELFKRARLLGSVFAAFAERFSALGDGENATRLCGWKIRRWNEGCVQEDWKKLPMEMAACLRTLANVCESEGRTQEAVQIRRTVLRLWRINNLWEVAPEIAGFVMGSGHKPLTGTELRSTVDLVPDIWRGEFEGQLRECEQLVGRLGMLQEQGRVAAMFPLLGNA